MGRVVAFSELPAYLERLESSPGKKAHATILDTNVLITLGYEVRADYEEVATALDTLADKGYRRQLQRLRDERAHYTRLLHDANFATTDAVIEKAETILELAINAKSHWESMNAPERREFLNKLLSNDHAVARTA